VAYVSLMLSLATTALGASIKFNEMAFVNYRNYPGGPGAFSTAFYATPVNMIDLSA
jgi:hypothetical protein